MRETSPRVLLIDDSQGYVRLAHKFLRRYEYATNCDLTNPCWECDYRRGCKLKQAHDWTEATEIMRRYGGEVDAILLDVHFDLPREQLVAETGLPGADAVDDDAGAAALVARAAEHRQPNKHHLSHAHNVNDPSISGHRRRLRHRRVVAIQGLGQAQQLHRLLGALHSPLLWHNSR